MENRFKHLPLIRILLLLSIPVYIFLSMKAPVRSTPGPILFRAVAFVAIAEAGLGFFLRARLISAIESAWQEQPKSKPALAHWFNANIVPWALCLSVAMYGIILRYVGYPFRSVTPFFLAGILLMLCFPPRRPEQAP